MNWFVERRLDFIDYRLMRFGNIRRDDIMQQFGVSTPQASGDLQEFLKKYPDQVFYDKSEKRYKAVPGYKSQRGQDKIEIHRAFEWLTLIQHPLSYDLKIHALKGSA